MNPINTVTEQGHGTGGYKSRTDSRDYTYEEVAFAAPEFNWDVGFDIETKLGIKLPIKDQGPSGSCGGQAWSNLAGVLEALATTSLEERSAKFIYAQTWVPGGGSFGRDNANIFIKQGAAREFALPSYENGMPPSEPFMERGQDIFQQTRQDAKSALSLSYSTVKNDIDEIAKAIRDTGGVVLGLDGQNNGTWSSAFPKVPTQVGWRHFMYGGKARLVNGIKYIGLLQSWGKEIGDPAEPGWQFLPEAYFTSGHIWERWTHVLSTPIPSVFTHNFQTNIVFGETSAEVIALQTALKLEGVFPSTVSATGFYGGVTSSAVLAFRVKYGIPSSSDTLGHSCGVLTRTKLNALYSH